MRSAYIFCSPHGTNICSCFPPNGSEMRWGIRKEASDSHQTSDICMQEMERCQVDTAGGINYMLMCCEK